MARLSVLGLLAATLTIAIPAGLPAVAADPCNPVVNAIACENSKPGTPQNVWDISGSGDQTIQGFATDMSVNVGGTISFKIKTPATKYHLDIYRLGYYGGDGARKITTVQPSATLPQSQPACLVNSSVGLVDCGNWAVSASWQVPSSAVSGIYFAELVRDDTGGESQIWFVVRNDSSHSAMVVQTSDTTWQAYNRYGGWSLYTSPDGSAVDRAYKVSYNRPFTTADYKGEDWVLNAEYPMVRFLERNGYDVSYISGIDTDRSGSLLKNHQVFVSSGHDEYWSGQQRSNVEAARDAGVDLAFFSGNEVYWKTRYESSSASGTATAYRTLVCYKESRDNKKTDPSSSWTGTWRDVRFSPPSDGGKPENALTGTEWSVQQGTTAIQVPAADGKMRLWRGTSVAQLSAGSTATLVDGSLGYEWDEDYDNGSRPAGLVDLSTTVANVASRIYDTYGNDVGAGTATHHMTLYKASSGALVFSTGTVQWAYGLDGVGNGVEDARMQQATINLFADMGVQPATLMSSLKAATASTDTTGPSVTISSPAAGATLNHGAAITVSGTATDSGGGVVGGVEVSVDGGATWHPAKGRESWSYATTVQGVGSVSVMARASDDSGNVGAAASRSVTVNCPCSVFSKTLTPGTPSVSDSSSVELGLRFRARVDGYATGVRFYKGTGNTGTHTGTLWSSSGTKLATTTFTGETATGWQEATFDQPVPLSAGTTYVVSYYAPAGHYAADRYAFQNAGTIGVPLYGLRDGLDGASGAFSSGPGFPTNGYQSTNYWVDVVFTQNVGPDVFPPSVADRSPAPDATGVDTGTTVSATFTESIQPGTTTVKLADATGNAVTGTTATNGKVVTFTPSAFLKTGTTYTVTVSGAKDLAGNTMSGSDVWSFTTTGPRTCPCTIFDPTSVPGTKSSGDSSSIELGVKFRTDTDGWVYGVRFYKGPSNGGTHVGSLWSSSGTLLARTTFSSETSGGWQQASFDLPVKVTANTTYVVSYYAPQGGYGYDKSYFATAGAGSSPIRALADGTDGGNGVYAYTGAPTFPSNSYSAANYWADVVFDTAAPPPDTTPPTVTSTTPADGATGVSASVTPSATFSEAVQASTVTMTLTGPSGAVAGTTSYDSGTKTVKFAATSGLVAGASYTATVSGATDLSGNVMSADKTWKFTLAEPSCPCTAFSATATPDTTSASDSSAITLGVRVVPDRDGYITGVRFWKGTGNTGTHIGRLWSSTGTLLASATFSGESSSGWQSVTFSNPVAVKAGVTYVASYYAPNGHYAVDRSFFATHGLDNSPLHLPVSSASALNGLYVYGSTGFPTSSYQASNYWVDVTMTLAASADTTPPTVTAQSPASGATGVDPATRVSATFSEPIDASGATFTLTQAGGGAVSGKVSLDQTGQVLTFTPDAQLEAATGYTATVSGATDLAGNTMSAAVTWSFTTGTPTCPCTIFGNATPGTASANDSSALELGVRFQADVNGSITGIRFYKGAGNTGTHTGTLWSNDGTKLATATFTNETATGWQTVTFASPVPITAGTTYVASYFAPNGGYAYDGGYFANGGTTVAPVRALADTSSAHNGVFLPGSSGFPTSTYNSANYWVDVVFTTP